MTTEQATSRFFKIFIPAMIVYIVGTASIRWYPGSETLPAYSLYALALIPIVAIFIAFWAQWRFAMELDEFLRLIQIKGTLVGIACVMMIASGWGQLERLADVPRLPVFWLLPIFWAVQGLATTLISKREGVF
ncbi:hypothetical protein K1718_20275 [Roseibium porphyridii]|uniref:Uncharacterized protein n=1 Tax=Roseibium porphyridii TaxID=2866279 RepID=A0ABY8EZF8_9HYPH|nr:MULTISPECIES: hypothetical protein [Stappiaceae]QFT33191.1 hypothetical protein FIV00_22055 [Labrenzia sp. THAF82]WFE88480.1 hypothetical protein K1718_20275 [Roseibium sp. KMA01]